MHIIKSKQRPKLSLSLVFLATTTTLLLQTSRKLAEASPLAPVLPSPAGMRARSTSDSSHHDLKVDVQASNQRQQRTSATHAKQSTESLAPTREADGGDSKPGIAGGTHQANSVEMSALTYLQKYGYMGANPINLEANNLIAEDSLSNAITSFQRFAGIPVTGVVDEQTVRFMEMPRCGNSDRPPPTLTSVSPFSDSLIRAVQTEDRQQPPLVTKFGRLRRRKRYALQGSKWRRQELTYRISQYPTRFNGKRHEVDAQIEKAFGIWSQVAPINFVVKREGRVHIDIRFASGDHGDGDAFDGPGNTLAHAYFPQYGGDAHFDDQEYWTIDSYAGTNIFQVAAHELGHSLGLGHSNVREALMAPFYQKYKPNFRLHIDDVLAIQALYGEKPFLAETVPQSTSISTSFSHQPMTTTTTTTTTTSTTTTTTPAPTTQRGTTHGQQQPTTWYSIFAHGIDSPTRGRPGIYVGGRLPPTKPGADSTTTTTTREVSNGASGDGEELPSNSVPDLAGNGLGAEDGPSIGTGGSSSLLPPSIGGGGVPPTNGGGADLCSDPVIDAITRTDDGNSYVFKGDHYWLLTSDGLAKGYPRRISADWDGLSSNLDAALTWADGKTFFFKGNKYWRYRNRRRDVGYPKLISSGFAGIPDDVDAAFVWSGNGRTYFFKGTEYWRFDSRSDPPVSSEYPRSIKIWNGVPSHANAAFKWDNNVTYFFKGAQYYRFNDKEFRVESRGRPPFPRQSAEWWFGCANSNLAAGRPPEVAFSSSLKDGPLDRDDLSNNSGNNQDTDWSFLAGLDESTPRIMGTHISDHRPPQSQQPDVSSSSANHNNNNRDPDDSVDLHFSRAAVSSSAISTTTLSSTPMVANLSAAIFGLIGVVFTLATSLSDVLIIQSVKSSAP